MFVINKIATMKKVLSRISHHLLRQFHYMSMAMVKAQIDISQVSTHPGMTLDDARM